MLNKLVLIKVLDQEKKTKSGIHIPIQNNLPYKKGVVVMIAKDCIQGLKTDDVTLYSGRTVQSANVPIDGVIYDMVREEGFMCVL